MPAQRFGELQPFGVRNTCEFWHAAEFYRKVIRFQPRLLGEVIPWTLAVRSIRFDRPVRARACLD
jgi:hypothetical protein